MITADQLIEYLRTVPPDTVICVEQVHPIINKVVSRQASLMYDVNHVAKIRYEETGEVVVGLMVADDDPVEGN